MKRDSSEEYLGKYEVVFGQHLDLGDPQLSPKVKQLVQDKLDIEQIFNAPEDEQQPKRVGEEAAPVIAPATGADLRQDHTLLVSSNPPLGVVETELQDAGKPVES